MLKILAAALMLVDHIGFVLFPGLIWMRVVGRFSMPLFAYAIASGFYFTSRKGTFPKYLLQIAIFAAVSQFPFWLAHQVTWHRGFLLNIGATWFLALLVLQGIYARESTAGLPIFFWRIAGVGAIIAALFIPVDFGIYGVLYPLACYPVVLALRNRVNAARAHGGEVLIDQPQFRLSPETYWFGGVSQLVLNAFGYFVLGFWHYQALAFLAFPLMLLDRGKKSRITKWLFYIIYPAHLLALWAIATYLR